MKCELCCDDDCLDLPSLTSIQYKGDGGGIHKYMGYVILESMIWFDLIWFDLIWLDIPNLTQNNIHYGTRPFFFTANWHISSRVRWLFHSLLDSTSLNKVIEETSRDWNKKKYDYG